GMPQRFASRLSLVEQSVEISQREGAAAAGIHPRRGADNRHRAALEHGPGLVFCQGQAALKEHEGRLERLVPARKTPVLDERIVVPLPQEEVLFGQQPAEFVGVNVTAEAGGSFPTAIGKLTGAV